MRNKTFIAFSVSLLIVAGLWIATSIPAAQASTGQRIALIIGNSNYVELSALQNPENDARAMAETLEQLDFDVILKIDADRRGMARAIRDFGRRLTASGTDAVGLFFYAGHGVQARNTNYLMPLQAEVIGEADLEIEAVDTNWVLSQMEEAGNALNIIILDACRNNPFRGSFRSAERGLARINAPTGSIVAYSAAPGQVAADGDGQNSPYTTALIQAMQEPGVELSRVFRQVRVDVTSVTGGDQTPWEEQSLTGDFFFVPAALAPATNAATQTDPEPVAPEVATPNTASPTTGATERQMDMELWRAVRDAGGDPFMIGVYLEQFPDGIFAAVARRMLEDPAPDTPTAEAEPAPQIAPSIPVPEPYQEAAIAPGQSQEAPADNRPATTEPSYGTSPGQGTTDPSQARVVFQFGHTTTVNDISVSPDGRYAVSGSDDGTLKVWSIDSGSLLMTIQAHTDGVRAVRFSPDGRTIVSGGGDFYVNVWDAESGALVRNLAQAQGSIEGIAISADGRNVAAGGSDGTLSIWDANSGKLINTFVGHTDWVRGAAFSPDGQYVATASDDNSVRLWDVNSGREIRSFKGHSNWVMSVAFSPDGRNLLSGSADQTMRLWDVNNGQQIRTFSDYTDWVRAVRFSSDGRMAISADDNQLVRVYDAFTGRNIQVFSGHTHWVFGVDVSSDGRRLVSGGVDGSVRIWNLSTGQQDAVFEAHAGAATAVAYSPDGTTIISAAANGTLKVWNAATGALIETWCCADEQVDYITMLPDGRRMLTGGGYSLQLWDTYKGVVLQTYNGNDGSVLAVSVSPDMRYVATGTSDHMARLWDLESGSLLLILAHHTDWVRDVAFTPDGRNLVSAADDKLLVRWDLNTGKVVQTYTGHNDWIRSVAILPDGQYMISAADDGQMIAWDIYDGKQLDPISGLAGWPLRVYLTPDGRQLLVGTNQDQMTLWDVTDGRLLRTYATGSGLVSYAFSPDGLNIASADASGLTLWRTDSAEYIARLTAVDDQNYFIELPDGRWTGSPEAVDRFVALFDGYRLLDTPATQHPSYLGSVNSMQLNTGAGFTQGSAIPRDADAAYRYGFWLLSGPIDSRDPYLAVQALQASANAGDARAMRELGVMLATGNHGVPVDMNLGADLLLRALRAGDLFAAIDLEFAGSRLSQKFREAIQIQLQQAGYYSGVIDGDFGTGTMTAINAYRGG